MGRLKWFLYLCAVLLIVIPTSIFLIFDGVTFPTTLSNTSINTAILLVILGKIITIYEKKKENKSLAPDIGIIIGVSIVLVTRFV
ncbi:histidine kinase [Oceanobacillus saliphilus]|uniref:histidine kinase n=1 Tax=Oceanobacillus saliphilus TaxID=2925834 RepID=UPI00201D537E|nr:histidine kinase [Oceanobacillus saliphilus]